MVQDQDEKHARDQQRPPPESLTSPHGLLVKLDNNDNDPLSTRIVRRMALYRVIIFGILVYEWNHYLPKDVAIRDGVDSIWILVALDSID
jgi:hypothetical protein